MGAGVFSRWWNGRDRETAHLRRKQRPVRLMLEPLEDRTVPAAIRNLGGFTANALAANDDGSTGAVNVGFNLNFFGVQSNQVFVNNNGNITFNQSLATFTPTDLNTNNGGTPIIAPFFADVDTRGTGNGAQVVTYGTDVLCGRPAFGVDWINVGYFSQNTSPLNSFQVILVDRSDVGAGDFDIEFNYDTIGWETGDASGGSNGLGGSSARVGYSNGTGNPGTFFELAGSGVNGAFLNGGPNALNTQTLLSSTPGRLHFLVRGGQVTMMTQAMSNLDVTGAVRIFNPLRYLFNESTNLMRGNLTIVNVGGVVTSPFSVDQCLDITATTTSGPAIPPLDPPINVFYPVGSTAPNTLANATGTTASGSSYITAALTTQLPALTPLRVQEFFVSPTRAAPTTSFFIGTPERVFSGTFDPTKL